MLIFISPLILRWLLFCPQAFRLSCRYSHTSGFQAAAMARLVLCAPLVRSRLGSLRMAALVAALWGLFAWVMHTALIRPFVAFGLLCPMRGLMLLAQSLHYLYMWLSPAAPIIWLPVARHLSETWSRLMAALLLFRLSAALLGFAHWPALLVASVLVLGHPLP